MLGWEPQVGLDDGLRRTIEYFRGVVAREGKGTT
jgi:nucleoside-diphosphate-sugar epimerase